MLVCQFCRATWTEIPAEPFLGFAADIDSLNGIVASQGAHDIDRSTHDIITLKCRGCGAEVVINSAVAVQARCHWCRSVLSLNTQVPNGAVPDAVLPFSVSHEQAVAAVREFAGKRMRFAQHGFKQEFQPENVVGVFMPYFVVDANTDVALKGEGEIQTRAHGGKSPEYDADAYHVEREFGLAIYDLTVAASARQADNELAERSSSQELWDQVDAARSAAREQDTVNVINAVLPFDVKNAVRFNANYLGAYTSEKRDLDVSQVNETLTRMVLGIGTTQMRNSLEMYTRGVRWDQGAVGIRGARFMTVYAPIWLYSYYEHKRYGTAQLHYIAVNGRTGWTMGSIPVDKKKLMIGAIGAGILPYACIALVGLVLMSPSLSPWFLILVIPFIVAVIFFWIRAYRNYRNPYPRNTAGGTGS